MKFTTGQIVIGVFIILGVLVAWYLIGDVALGGLLALFGLGRGKGREQAEKLRTEANMDAERANKLASDASDKQQEAKKVDQEIDEIIEEPVDYEKPVEEVVENAKKDWD